MSNYNMKSYYSNEVINMRQFNEVDIEQKEIKNELKYESTVILEYTIRYPQFSSNWFIRAVKIMNKYYEENALKYKSYIMSDLYKMAVEEYKNSVANGYPIRKFEAFMDYTITYNQNCAVSLYFDKYEFTGGAHGNTIRTSDTWSLKRGSTITLESMFPTNNNYIEEIKKEITDQIAEQIASGNNVYFEDYQKLVNEYFNTNNFYIIPNNLVIYFQQYEIAPYSSGIPTFSIPFAKIKAYPPNCM